jgi:hypothetical protein
MSALGQKQTYALQQDTSALHPIATAKATSRKWSCPLYPRKRTYAVHKRMSALGQERTLSFEDVVGPALHRLRHCDAEPFGGLEIDDQLDLC